MKLTKEIIKKKIVPFLKTRKVSNKLKSKYNEVKWAEFIENRNFLTHVYQLVNDKRL